MTNHTNLILAQKNEKIELFLSLVKGIAESWVKAGEILVELVKDDPNIYDEIIARAPMLNTRILAQFEAMGSRKLHPRLVLGTSAGYSRLAKLPLSLQERYLDEPVSMVVETSSGADTLLVKVRDLTPKQAEQVFAADHVRSEGEQRAWLVGQKQKWQVVQKPAQRLYSIKNGKAVINGVEFTQRQLLHIAAELTK